MRNNVCTALLSFLLLLSASSSALADPFAFSYGGRLTEATGKPVEGPIKVEVSFFALETGGTPLGSVVQTNSAVPLHQGVFNLTIALSANDFHGIFSDFSLPVWIEVKDATHNKIYPRQKFNMVPTAALVPVDDKTVAFDTTGKLSVGPLGAPSTGQFLTKDSSGLFIWATAPAVGTSLQGQTVNAPTPAAGNVLKFDGTDWINAPLANGTVTGLSAAAPFAVATASTTPAISMTAAATGSDGYLAAGDWLSFNSKQAPLGFSPVNKTGDSMSGVLNMAGNKITSLANPVAVTDAANKSTVDSAIGPYIKKDGSTALSGDWAVANHDIIGINTLKASSIVTNGQNALRIDPWGTTSGKTGEIHFSELSVVSGRYIGFKASDTIAANAIWTLPATDGATGYVLKTDGTGHLSWTDPAAAAGAVTSVAGRTGVVTLTSDDVADGTTNKYQTDATARSFAVADSMSDGVTTIAASQNAVFDALAGKIDLTGGTMTGALNLGNQALTNVNNASAATFSTSTQAAVVVNPYGAAAGQTGELRLKELSVVRGNYVGFKAADSVASSKVWTLPGADGTTGQVLKTDASGQLAWVSPASLTVADSMTDAVTTIAPSQNAVFDGLALKLDKTGGTMNGVLNMGTQKITGLATPGTGSDAATMAYADSVVLPYVKKDGSVPLTGNWATGGSNISGVGAFSAGPSSVSSLATSAQAGVTVKPFGAAAGETGEFRMKDLSGARYEGFKAPDALAANKIWTLPATDGSNNQVLKTDGLGTLSWVSASSLSVVDSISDGVITTAPSENAVFDALALKLDTAGGTMSGAIDMGAQKITNLATPASNAAAANMSYADGVVAPYLKKDGSVALTANWAVGGFNITGVGTFTAAAATLSSFHTAAQGGIVLNPYGASVGNSSEIRFKELGGTGRYVGFKAPDTIAVNKIFVLPAADGATNNLLKTDGASNLSWTSASALSVADAIADSVTTIAPSQNAVFDALALKLDTSGGTLSGALDLGSNAVTNLATATNPGDAINQTYADGLSAPYLQKNGSTPLTSPWAVGGFNITGVGSFSATTATVTTLGTTAQAAANLGPYGTLSGNTAELRFKELAANGNNYAAFKAPNSIAADKIWTLPATDGSAHSILKTDGAGTLSWVSGSSLAVQDTIVDGVTTLAPSQNAVFDALALKLNLNGGTVTGPIDMGTAKITSLATPTAPSDAATKAYVDGVVAPYLRINGSTPLTAAWAVGGFDITGVAAFSSISVAATTLSSSGQAALTIGPYNSTAGTTGEVRFKRLSGIEYVGFKAPDTITASKIWTVPGSDGSSGYVLKTDGLGNFTWTAAAATSVQDSIADAVTTIAPSQNAVFDALALKLPLSGGNLTGALNMSNQKITGLALPTVGPDAASKDYVDTALAPYVKKDGSVPLTGNWAVGSFNINGINNIGSTAVAAATVTTNTQAGFTLDHYGANPGETGQSHFRELTNSKWAGFKAPDSISIDRIWTLPSADGSANQVLKTDGSGNLSWTSPATLTVADSIVDAVTNVAPSQNVVFDALALKLNKTGGTMSGVLDMGTRKITSLATPTNPADAVTKTYADGVFTPYLKKDGSTTLTSTWAVGGFDITNAGSFVSSGAMTLSALTTTAQGAVVLGPFNTGAGQTGELQFQELSVVRHNSVGFKAPDTIAATQIWTLPAADGTANQLLKTDGAGKLGWVTASSLNVAQTISSGVTNIAPSENVVFNAFALKANRSGTTLSGALAMSNTKITGLATPLSPTDASTMAYVDSSVSGYLKRDGTTPLTANWAVGNNLSGIGTLAAGATSVSSLASTGAVSGTSLSSTAQAAFTAAPWGAAAGNTGEIQFKALTGSNYVGFKAPDTIGTSGIWTLPFADGTASQLLKTDGSKNMGWVSASTAAVANIISSGVVDYAPSEGAVYTALQSKINKSGDTMTGALVLPSNGLTVGTNQFVVANGNVGIGEANPTFPLTFASTNGDKLSLFAASGNHYGFGIGAGVFQIHTLASTDNIAFGYGTGSSAFTTTVVFKGTGDVGVGPGTTTTPAGRLHVQTTGAANTETVLALLDSNNGYPGGGSAVEFKEKALLGTGGGYMGAIAAVDNGALDGTMEFRVSGDAAINSTRMTSSSTRMVINSAGAVGIGTTGPEAPLHLLKPLADWTEGALLVLDSNNSSTGSGSSIQFKTNSSTGAGYVAAIAGLDDTDSDGRLEFRVSSDGIATTSPLTSASTKVVLTQNGYLGIGQSSPAFPLSFANTVGDKIAFHYSSGNSLGFGIQNNLLQIHASASNEDVTLGAGTGSTFTEYARIKGSGNMGIGVNNPDSRMHVRGGGIHTEKANGSLGMALGTCPYGSCPFPYETIQLSGGANLRLWYGSTERFVFTPGGAALKGGTLAWENLSDIRTKNVHSQYTLGLKEILQLTPIVYSYKKDNPRGYNSDAEYVGFSAQEVQKVIPRAVHTDEKGYLSLTSDPIIWAMFNALKEENAERKLGQTTLNAEALATNEDLKDLKMEFRAKRSHLDTVKTKLDSLVKALCKDEPTKDCQP